MLDSENTIKTIALYCPNQLRIFYWRILLYNPIIGYTCYHFGIGLSPILLKYVSSVMCLWLRMQE